ncbi:DHA2 family lincomycin resistance protein-like MFS transporter [Nocardioides luteus]|uniref:MFS transporter n=1 Tax=Nocardioides luteus TaxID=1844 RepID=A0ABQ5SW41_9ACTN|nr:MDR family MFS transporter [Nocardioides luteus]MDR7311786.1 DHA2 family lincomycin resistance protein-like MFS transporter [Nocardioides luteus]GGR65942.1 MFS transporter [Nocardioides luteus]GLJ68029.1 MFS transporter [Nocardioides luteus]
MTAVATPPHRPLDGEKRRTPAVITLLVLATFVVILNETIMLNAIPNLMRSFGVTEHAAQWVSTAFMLTMASVIPVTGWFLQRVTTRTAYATAMGVFIAGTLISAIAPVFGVLLAGRVIQAAGTAVMMPLLMTTLMNVVDESDRGRVMGNVTMAISVAPALGPTLSGLILGFGSWRLLFLLVLPIAIGVAWSGLRRLENVNEPAESSVDWASVVVAALGFGSLVYGLSRFAEGEVGLPLAIAGLGALLILGFVMRQLRLQRVGSPLLDLRAFRHSTFTKALVLMAIAFLAMMGSMILLPLYLQTVRGLSPLYTGLLVMPGGLAMGLLGPTVGRIFDTYGGRVLVIPGSVGIVVALAGLSQISLTTPFWLVLVLHLVLMVSLAAAFTPVFTLGLGSLPQHLYSHGSSILGTLQQVAAAFGTALAVTVMAVRSDQVVDEVGDLAAQVSGLQAAFMVSAALALVVVAMAVLLPARADGHEDAAEELATESATEPDTDLDAELAELCEHGREPATCGC